VLARARKRLVDPLGVVGVSVALDATTGLVRDRCDTLAQADFLHRRERIGLDAKYSITMDGIRYLNGEIDADLRRLVPAPRPPHAMRPAWFAGLA
jgi:hypothetical protein